MKLRNLLLLLALTPVPLAAQDRLPPAHVDAKLIPPNLLGAIIVEEPTVLALISLDMQVPLTDRLARAQVVADSIATALGPTAARLGYTVEVRLTSFLGIWDFAHGASYRPSPERGPGILLVRPGVKPSILYPMMSPEELRAALNDYMQLVRPIVPL